MLNPSVADEFKDDNTTTRVLNFAKKWGYGTYEAVNLFAFIATSPKNMKKAPLPIGDRNDEAILRAVHRADMTVAAWGTDGPHRGRDREVLELLRDEILHCLKVTDDGHPGHPLYLPRYVKPLRYAPLSDV